MFPLLVTAALAGEPAPVPVDPVAGRISEPALVGERRFAVVVGPELLKVGEMRIDVAEAPAPAAWRVRSTLEVSVGPLVLHKSCDDRLGPDLGTLSSRCTSLAPDGSPRVTVVTRKGSRFVVEQTGTRRRVLKPGTPIWIEPAARVLLPELLAPSPGVVVPLLTVSGEEAAVAWLSVQGTAHTHDGVEAVRWRVDGVDGTSELLVVDGRVVEMGEAGAAPVRAIACRDVACVPVPPDTPERAVREAVVALVRALIVGDDAGFAAAVEGDADTLRAEVAALLPPDVTDELVPFLVHGMTAVAVEGDDALVTADDGTWAMRLHRSGPDAAWRLVSMAWMP